MILSADKEGGKRAVSTETSEVIEELTGRVVAGMREGKAEATIVR